MAFVHRPSLFDKKADESTAYLLVRKHRGGPTGDVRLTWQGRLMSFAPHEDDGEDRLPFQGDDE